jgi:hypothetical protein
MGMGYVYIAGGFVLLAIVFNFIAKFDPRDWITRGLERGDLHSLVDVASGLRPDGLTRNQATRLQARGMVEPNGSGNFRATLKGRLALRIRQMTRRPHRSAA